MYVKFAGSETDDSTPSGAELRMCGAISSVPHTSTWCGADQVQGQM